MSTLNFSDKASLVRRQTETLPDVPWISTEASFEESTRSQFDFVIPAYFLRSWRRCLDRYGSFLPSCQSDLQYSVHCGSCGARQPDRGLETQPRQASVRSRRGSPPQLGRSYFTETGNPIDPRQNFQREANARLKARIGTYLTANPVCLPYLYTSISHSLW